MKLIHLSDLHLGKKVNGYSMIEDQKHIINEIYKIIDSEKPDGVLIAGDVYDKSVPVLDAIELFDSFLVELAGRGIPTFVIAGNHDSVERMSFASRLMESEGVFVSRTYSGHVDPITLEDENGDVNIYMLPFIKPAAVKRYFEDQEIGNYTDMMKAVVGETDIDTDARNVLVSHQFVTGAVRSDSEEVSVGGIDNIDAAAFEGFDYVALGHIHGPQNMDGGRIRYCGTPLKYSMSEAGHEKSVTVVELFAKGDVSIRTIGLTPLRDMRKVEGLFADVIEAGRGEGEACSDYVHVVLKDEDEVAGAYDQLRKIYPNIMGMNYDNTRTRNTEAVGLAQEVDKKSELELFAELFTKQNGRDMSPEQEEYMTALINDLKGAK
ncbi:MAG: exonuclease SbcCD subunit D [Eubacterium sp.]|nr:exonuclease SbcCD subunit D [Candidatus Colimonas fimequi]